MNREKIYRVPDILDIIYEDVVLGLYTQSPGKTIGNRIKIAKFNLACDFLINTLIDEDEIVHKLDFSDTNEFRTNFENFLGISPLSFRKRFCNIKQ